MTYDQLVQRARSNRLVALSATPRVRGRLATGCVSMANIFVEQD